MDQFRGYTVAGMFLVNFVGGLAAFPEVLKHHNGHPYFSYADSIMPSFMVAPGFSYRLTTLRRLAQQGAARTYWHALVRSLALVLISLVMYAAEDLHVKNWAEMTAEGVWKLVGGLLKANLWEVLAIIGVVQVLILPVIAASARVRTIAWIACAVIHVVISQSFNFSFVYGKTNWMDDLVGLTGPSAWDGGFFGVLGWAVPMLLGTTVYDIVVGGAPRIATRSILTYGAQLMGMGYAFNCLATLYDIEEGSVALIGDDIAASPVTPPFANAQGRSLESLFATPPCIIHHAVEGRCYRSCRRVHHSGTGWSDSRSFSRLANRHTQSYYRGAQLDQLPLPDRPLPDPDDPEVIHRFRKRDGTLWEETSVGREVYRAVIEYAFGTSDRYLTLVSRDARGGYHLARLSYYDTPEGRGWDRSILDRTYPSRGRAQEFQGEEIGLRDGLARCLYCHLTNPRAGREPIGPETADRAIGCERCHGPGGNHLASIQAGFRDSAIVNPGAASPAAVTTKQCNDCHILDRNFPNGDPDNPGWVRSQGVGWTLSRCNTESDGAFGCVTCHDPHKSARATTTAQYEVKCLACHGRAVQPEHNAKAGSTPLPRAEVRARICPVDSSKGCIPCHMPRVRIDPLHLDLTDHYIRVDRRKR